MAPDKPGMGGTEPPTPLAETMIKAVVCRTSEKDHWLHVGSPFKVVLQLVNWPNSKDIAEKQLVLHFFPCLLRPPSTGLGLGQAIQKGALIWPTF